LIIGVFCATFLIVSTTKTKAASEIDQQFTTGADSFLLWGGTDANYQVFKPSKNILDKVAVEIYDFNPVDKIEFKIKKWNGSGWDLVKMSKPLSLVEGWNEFSFAAVSVTPETRYAIFINISTDGGPRWKCSKSGGYDRGYVIAQGTEQPYWDANFKTWGYDASSPAGGTANSNSQIATGTSGTANSNKAGITNSNSTTTNSAGANQNQADTNPFPVLFSIGGFEITPFTFYGICAVAILSIILAYLIYRRKQGTKGKDKK